MKISLRTAGFARYAALISFLVAASFSLLRDSTSNVQPAWLVTLTNLAGPIAVVVAVAMNVFWVFCAIRSKRALDIHRPDAG